MREKQGFIFKNNTILSPQEVCLGVVQVGTVLEMLTGSQQRHPVGNTEYVYLFWKPQEHCKRPGLAL